MSNQPSHIVPPLPRRAPSLELNDARSTDSPSTENGDFCLTPSVPPTAVDAFEPQHRLSAWAVLILVTGATALVTSMLVGGHRAFDQLQPASRSLVLPAPRAVGARERPPSDVNTAIVEQFVQLDEVQITSSDDKMDVPEDVPPQRTALRPAIARDAHGHR